VRSRMYSWTRSHVVYLQGQRLTVLHTPVINQYQSPLRDLNYLKSILWEQNLHDRALWQTLSAGAGYRR